MATLVTADDFVFSYRRLVDPATAAIYTQSIRSVANADAILAGQADVTSLGVQSNGPNKLIVDLEQPTPYFLSLLAHPSMFPLHPPSVQEHGDRHARPGNLVSNGAYRLVAWEVGSYIELERNEYFWDDANTSIDRVRHHITPEPMAELNRYRAGELHITRTIPPEMFAEMQRERPDEVRVSAALNVYYYGFNLSVEQYANNPKLRQAMSMAIDREAIVKLIGRGEQVAYSWVPPGTAGFEPQIYSWADLTGRRTATGRRNSFSRKRGSVRTTRPRSRFTTTHTRPTHRSPRLIQSMWLDVLGIEAAADQ